MSPVVIDLRSAEDRRDVVHRAVQALAEGGVVAFPTETVYGLAASALDEAAVCRLVACKDRKAAKPLTLAIKSADEARDYAPDMCPLAQRLARRCWPGPVTLVVDDTHPESLVRQLPSKVQQAVSPARAIGLRVPGHQVILDVLGMLAGPLTLSSANRAGMPEAATAREVVDAFGSEISLVVDDGPCRFGQPSSVVRVQHGRYEILRAGVVPERTIKRLSSLIIVFVCTGNTCRSPMAELLCRDMVAKRLNCKIDELEDRGVLVMSAGVAALLGGRAAHEAVEAMEELGLDLRAHETQPLTEPLVRHADMIYTMTACHRDAIVSMWPSAAERTRVLATDGSEICDPIGSPVACYRRCAAEIQEKLKARLKELPLPPRSTGR
jgi:tRNA threonylcarbamoyl adenosine modification protein (Sua5/YciO/YrdC/YwlC family)